MRVIYKVWTHPLSATIGFVVMAVALLWPAVPLRGLDLWFATLTGKFPTNLLYPIYVLLVGSYAALYSYDKWVARCCQVSAAKTALPSLAGVLLGACPACIPVIAFFLPVSLTITLGYYSWIILAAAIALILFSIWRVGGSTFD